MIANSNMTWHYACARGGGGVVQMHSWPFIISAGLFAAEAWARYQWSVNVGDKLFSGRGVWLFRSIFLVKILHPTILNLSLFLSIPTFNEESITSALELDIYRRTRVSDNACNILKTIILLIYNKEDTESHQINAWVARMLGSTEFCLEMTSMMLMTVQFSTHAFMINSSFSELLSIEHASDEKEEPHPCN